MNIHTYIEKIASKAPLNQRIADFLQKNIIYPVGFGAMFTAEGIANSTLRPIKRFKDLYNKEALKSFKKDFKNDPVGDKIALISDYAGDVAARGGMGYGAYRGGKKIKEYFQDKKRGK